MLGAVLDAGGAVGVLSVGVLLPLVLDGVVALHGRALLLADAVVEEVAARQAVGLLGAGAAAGAEEVAALARLRAEAAAAVALRAAVELGELLAVVGALAPAAGRAGLVARHAVPLGLGELVHVDELLPGAGDDLLPLDGLDVAQVVVVHDADASLEDV